MGVWEKLRATSLGLQLVPRPTDMIDSVEAGYFTAGPTVFTIANRPIEGVDMHSHGIHTRDRRATRAINIFCLLQRVSKQEPNYYLTEHSQFEQRWHIIEDVDRQGREVVIRKEPGSPCGTWWRV